MFYLDEPKNNKSISKTEWEVIKAIHKNKCVICGKTEKQVGILEKAHIKAKSRGGSQYLPMCATHHTITPKKKKKETYFDGSEVV